MKKIVMWCLLASLALGSAAWSPKGVLSTLLTPGTNTVRVVIAPEFSAYRTGAMGKVISSQFLTVRTDTMRMVLTTQLMADWANTMRVVLTTKLHLAGVERV